VSLTEEGPLLFPWLAKSTHRWLMGHFIAVSGFRIAEQRTFPGTFHKRDDKARFGYSLISIAKNRTFDNSIEIFSYVSDDQFYTLIYDPTTSTWINNSSMLTVVYGQAFPLSKYLLVQYFYISMNSSLFDRTFSSNFLVKLQTSTTAVPTGDFLRSIRNITFDETAILNVTLNQEVITFSSGATRLEPLHLAWYIPTLFGFIVFFVLCILYRNGQPLKSRGIVPLLACICQFMMLISEFPNFMTLESYQYLQSTVFFAFNFSLLSDPHVGFPSNIVVCTVPYLDTAQCEKITICSQRWCHSFNEMGLEGSQTCWECVDKSWNINVCLCGCGHHSSWNLLH
jgi:hypothetical protein